MCCINETAATEKKFKLEENVTEQAKYEMQPGISGKTEDFKACYENYYKIVFRHAAYLTGSIHTAEDITQEAFIRLYNSPPDHGNAVAWLSRVATNLSYNHLRNEKARRSKDPVIEEAEGVNVISIEDVAIKDSEIRLTRKILNMLPPRDRICLLLKFSGYRYCEISEITGVEKVSVGQVLARAQKKFREMYLKEGQGL